MTSVWRGEAGAHDAESVAAVREVLAVPHGARGRPADLQSHLLADGAEHF